ncbi:MAG: hypothetical protein ACYTAF_01110 [Planctomycetota bacterium]|jgi:hypothetical protein
MSILSRIFKRKKKLTDLKLDELRVEEKRLEIRENQHLNKLEKLDKQREEIFNNGAKTKSPARRRIYARRFGEISKRCQMIEREVSRVVKELMTLNRVRTVLERDRKVPTENVLKNLNDADMAKLTSMLEDDRITEEVYLQKLDVVLGVTGDSAYEMQELGEEGLDVLKTWERMDEGELEFDDALKEASGGVKEKESEEGREAEPAF